MTAGTGTARTAETAQRTASEIRSYVALRLTVGVIAVLLPVLVVVIVAFRENAVLASLSDSYYHRYANSIFIGAMFAFAAFLFSYEFSTWENVLGNLGALAAALVAVFPTPPDAPTREQTVGGYIHFSSATVFFVVLAVFCYVWSRDPAQGEPRRSYRVSSVLIVLAIVTALALKALERFVVGSGALAVGFLLAEVAVVEFFGFSWLLRGGVRVVRAWIATTVATAATVVVIVVPDAAVDRRVPGALGLVAVLAVLALLFNQRPGRKGNRLTPSS